MSTEYIAHKLGLTTQIITSDLFPTQIIEADSGSKAIIRKSTFLIDRFAMVGLLSYSILAATRSNWIGITHYTGDNGPLALLSSLTKKLDTRLFESLPTGALRLRAILGLASTGLILISIPSYLDIDKENNKKSTEWFNKCREENKKEFDKNVKEMKEEHDESVKEMKEEHDKSVKEMKEEHDKSVKEMKEKFNAN